MALADASAHLFPLANRLPPPLAPQDMDSEKRKVACRALRFLAHTYGGNLLFVSQRVCASWGGMGGAAGPPGSTLAHSTAFSGLG